MTGLVRNFMIGAVALLAAGSVSSCMSDPDDLADYSEWIARNEQWLVEQQATGKYERVTPLWNPRLHVMMRWLNDRTETEENLIPLYTSQMAVKYRGYLCDGTQFDSSFTTSGDSIATLSPSELISGWAIATEVMHVGDSVEVIIPSQAAYGSSGVGAVPPYSALRFEIVLRDITAYEVKPGRLP